MPKVKAAGRLEPADPKITRTFYRRQPTRAPALPILEKLPKSGNGDVTGSP